MSTPRILYVCHGHPALQPGGTEILAHDLFRAVGNSGQAETTFAGCVTGLHRQPHPECGFQTLGRSRDEVLLWVSGFDRLMLGHSHLAAFAKAFGELLTTFQPQIVHFHHLSLVGIEALVLVRRLLPAARIVLTLHDYHLICANDGLLLTRPDRTLCHKPGADACHRCFPEVARKHFVARHLHLKSLLTLVDAFIAPSQWLKDRHVAWGLPAARIEVLRNGVPGTPEPAALNTSVPRPRRAFGLFGNIAPHKGVLTALSATHLLSEAGLDLTLRLHGGLGFQDEAFRSRFAEALAEASPVAVHAGAYDREQIGDLLAQVDWVLVPSLWWENAPLVVLEAFRHRRPVICSNLGGLKELVEHDVNGLLVPAGDTLEWARTMRRAVKETGLWERLRAAAPDVLSTEDCAAQHLALYRKLLHRTEALSA